MKKQQISENMSLKIEAYLNKNKDNALRVLSNRGQYVGFVEGKGFLYEVEDMLVYGFAYDLQVGLHDGKLTVYQVNGHSLLQAV